MSETIDQADTSTASVEATPLESILDHGAADVPASSPGGRDAFGEAPGELDREPGGRGFVPHAALHAERERRKRVDARVKQLEDELQRFNDQKWGVDEAWEAERQAEQAAAPETAFDAFTASYDKSYAAFTKKHGKDRVAAIDAAIPRLTKEQFATLQSEMMKPGDPVENVHAYVQKLGFLEPVFKPSALQDVLAGKKQPEPGEQSAANAKATELEQRERAIAAAERRTAFAASKSEFVSEYGKQQFLELDAASTSLMQSGHPFAADFAKAIAADPDPVGAAAEILTNLGLWSPAPVQQQQQYQAQRQQPLFPTDFSRARNVGVRHGPAWGGPEPLNSIFSTKRKAG